MRRVKLVLAVIAVFSLGFGGLAKVRELENVYVLLVHQADGTVYVADTYDRLARARKAAQLVRTDPSSWVIITPSLLHESRQNEGGGDSVTSFFRKLGFGETAHAQIILDGVTNSIVSLPASLRSGVFTSPEVRFTSQFETIIFTLFLPDDADWLNPANTIDFQIEFSPDRTPGSWNVMCSSFSTFGSGRPLDKQGVPSTGGHTGCSGRDTNNQLYPVTMWYRMTLTLPNPMTIGGEVAIPR